MSNMRKDRVEWWKTGEDKCTRWTYVIITPVCCFISCTGQFLLSVTRPNVAATCDECLYNLPPALISHMLSVLLFRHFVRHSLCHNSSLGVSCLSVTVCVCLVCVCFNYLSLSWWWGEWRSSWNGPCGLKHLTVNSYTAASVNEAQY